MKRYSKRLLLQCCAVLLVVFALLFGALMLVPSTQTGYRPDANFFLWVGVTVGVAWLLACVCAAILLRHLDAIISERNERLGAILHNTSHELKTPLTLTMANLDLLEMERGSDELIDDMREECQQMTRLVQKMVELSRAEEVEQGADATAVNVGRLVSRCLELFRPAGAARGLSLSTDIVEGLFCDVVESDLKQVIFILMDNAIKYCDDGGTVAVAVRPLGSLRVEICVENSFAAIDPAEFPHLFDRFYRADATKYEVPGDGLGLAIAQACVKRLGGSIEAYERKVRGYIGFRVILQRSFC